MKNGHRILYKVMRKGELDQLIFAVMEDNKIHITNVFFNEWEMNRRFGTIEDTHSFNEENTLKLYESLNASSTSDLFQKIKSKIGNRQGPSDFMDNLNNFCDESNIEYSCSVWY